MSKVTKATIKSFINKNKDNLLIRFKSHFDGMYDSTVYNKDPEWHKAVFQEGLHSNCLGVSGAWFVGSSRDYFSPVKDGDIVGYHVSNSCGSFDLGVKVVE